MELSAVEPDAKTELSRLYHAALRSFLKQGAGLDLETARELGHHAVSRGLETLDLARIHEIALVALVLPSYTPNTSSALMGRAGLFFAEAITPIERTHRGAREANARLNHLVDKLARSVGDLKSEIVLRTTVEASLRDSQRTTSILLQKSRDMEVSLRHLSHQVLSAQEEERRRISRELHDVIAQSLAGINIHLAVLKAGSHDHAEQLEEAITSTQLLVTESVNIVHRFARELRPTMLDDLGLIPALKAYLKKFTEDSGVRVSLTVFAEIERADGAVRTMLFRVAQEALTNVIRHAHASQVNLTIVHLDGGIRMEITDNGTGFAVDEQGNAPKSNRLGLMGMRERAEMVGGLLVVISAPGGSTTIRVAIPRDRCEAQHATLDGMATTHAADGR